MEARQWELIPQLLMGVLETAGGRDELELLATTSITSPYDWPSYSGLFMGVMSCMYVCDYDGRSQFQTCTSTTWRKNGSNGHDTSIIYIPGH
jgi:hypothetical protein